ncbi:MAG: isopentenyl phosphate kinase [Parcubacteria group bacterium]|jgi:isopentenyl phosphate kinase
MKPLYILKIGGSVATYKNKPGISVRNSLLKKIGQSIKKSQEKGNFDLILIHGAGAAGHQLAKKYSLQEGIGVNPKKWYGALISRLANNKLNTAIAETFTKIGLRIAPVHTASAIIQKNKKISRCSLKMIQEALRQNCIPILYGEMVFDTKLGMSICSGDAIAPYLAKKLEAKKIMFASDIDGIFTQDPHIYKDAELIEKINLKEINQKAKVSHSHNVDVTGGLLGKINKIEFSDNLQSIEIFNGLDPENYQKIFLGQKFSHTIILP